MNDSAAPGESETRQQVRNLEIPDQKPSCPTASSSLLTISTLRDACVRYSGRDCPSASNRAPSPERYCTQSSTRPQRDASFRGSRAQARRPQLRLVSPLAQVDSTRQEKQEHRIAPAVAWSTQPRSVEIYGKSPGW